MSSKPPDRDLLIGDLTAFLQAGYRVGDAEASLTSLKVLTDLRVVGGPDRPRGVLAWGERLESVRSLLRSIAEDEVRAALGDQYAEVTVRLFRLDKKKPMTRLAHIALNDLQDELGGVFGVRRRVFVEKHRLPILEVIADALIRREQEAAIPDDALEESNDAEEIADDAEAQPIEPSPEENDGEDEDAMSSEPEIDPPPDVADGERPTLDESSSESSAPEPSEDLPSTPLAVAVPPPTTSPPTGEPRPQRLRGTARALVLVVSLIAVAAVALLVIRNQSSDPGQPKSETARQAKTSPQPAVPAPSKDSANTPSVPPIDFTAEVVNWCYCGDEETLESQIKIKPRLVNHSARRIDLRTGGSARLGLAIHANASSDRSWITPTEPRYRRYGKWLVVPPNAPGDLVSTTMFETHWNRISLRPVVGKYLDPDEKEGDLVFNVPPDLAVGGYRVRMAYRLHNGDLYFPRKGAAEQWHGYREEGSTF